MSARRIVVRPAALLLASLLPAQNWIAVHEVPRRAFAAAAFDSTRARTILFGGVAVAATGSLSDTWEWDGTRWNPRQPALSPGGRRAHAMAYDAGRMRVVLFGGADGSTVLGDTWEWDGVTWNQRAAVGPSPRYGHAMTFDQVRGRVVLFGGLANLGGLPFADTWEWDGTSWLQRSPATSPLARTGAAMAFDTVRGRSVLFGGSFWSSVYSDTWEWDGLAWVQRAPATSPPPHEDHGMVYDSGRGRIVLVGGRTLFDTWEWNGNNWSQQQPATSLASQDARCLAYDAARSRTVLVETTGRTLEWDGVSWTQQAAVTPAAAFGRNIAYDEARNEIVLLVSTLFNETWTWDGWRWRRSTPAASPPSLRGISAMAYHGPSQTVVLFDGSAQLADTWEWNGSNWRQRLPATVPPPRTGHAMAHDAARGRVVMFGGLFFQNPTSTILRDDTWEWDGSNWLPALVATHPSARGNHAMAYDPLRGRTVLFGGFANGPLDDTWQWDGSSWVLRQPATRPSPRYDVGMAFDSARGRAVLAGGTIGETWEWDGTTWSLLPIPNPPPVISSSMAYDALRAQMILVADRTWRLASQAAAVTGIGSACPGTNGLPVLACGPPALGSGGFALELHSAVASSPCLFGLALAGQNLPLGGGCTLYLGGSIAPSWTATNAVGFARAVVPIPAAPALQGLVVHAQAAALDPLGAFAGLAFTAGLQLTVGW
jgi:hypothetical protein